MINKFKTKWNDLSSKAKKIIKTFVQAGAAYIATYFAAAFTGIDSNTIKVIAVSAIAAGLAAVMNIDDKG